MNAPAPVLYGTTDDSVDIGTDKVYVDSDIIRHAGDLIGKMVKIESGNEVHVGVLASIGRIGRARSDYRETHKFQFANATESIKFAFDPVMVTVLD